MSEQFFQGFRVNGTLSSRNGSFLVTERVAMAIMIANIFCVNGNFFLTEDICGTIEIVVAYSQVCAEISMFHFLSQCS